MATEEQVLIERLIAGMRAVIDELSPKDRQRAIDAIRAVDRESAAARHAKQDTLMPVPAQQEAADRLTHGAFDLPFSEGNTSARNSLRAPQVDRRKRGTSAHDPSFPDRLLL